MPARKRFVSTKVEVEGREETRIVELPDLEPAPWGDDASLTIVGQRVPRMDALEKVTGRARYTADVHRAAMLHAAFVRAPIASGRVLRLDASRALALPGVRGVLLAEDVPGVIHAGAPLFDAIIHWAGQPLAAICADTESLAREAAALVSLELETRPHVVTPGAARATGAPLVRPPGTCHATSRAWHRAAIRRPRSPNTISSPSPGSTALPARCTRRSRRMEPAPSG